MLAGVLSCFCAVSASPSDGPAAVSQPPASTTEASPVMLGEIFQEQLRLLGTLKVRLDTLQIHNEKLQNELDRLQGELDESNRSLQLTSGELTELKKKSELLKGNLSQSTKAERALQISLRESSSLLDRAQSSLARVERDRWIMAAAALAAGAILGGLLL